MLRSALCVVVAFALFGCPPPPPPFDGGVGGGTGGGSGGDGGLSPFEVISLDAMAKDATYFAVAVDPAQERVGVLYLSPRGTQTMMGTPDYDIKYLEWTRAGGVTAPQTLRYVQRFVGLALEFDPTTGEPIASYLGGDPGFMMGESVFWFQSDAVINRRSGGSTWTETRIATDGNQVTCGNRVSDNGFLVGLWPALAHDSAGKLYFGYRDGHFGQFPQQDWAGSDVEVWDGTTTPSAGTCVAEGGNSKNAWGGFLQMKMCAGDQPAIVHSQIFGTADVNGNNVFFQKRNANGTWTSPAQVVNVANVQTGPSLACDAQEGYGIAVVDRATNVLAYTNSLNGTTWSSLDPVYGAGSGGWYPSLAMDPVNHEPAIAFYICSPRSAVNETSCTTTEDKLVVMQRIVGTWREVLVDAEGGYAPKLNFFSSGKRVVVYRGPPAVNPDTGLTVANVGVLKLAVER